jgi:hypothetical protein
MKFQKSLSCNFLLLLSALIFFFSIQSIAQIKIMPVGNSVTQGLSYSPGSDLDEGYRGYLYDLLVNNGYNDVEFVGTLTNGNALPSKNHEGHSGWYANKVSSFGGGGPGIAAAIDSFLTVNPSDIVLLHIGTNDLTLLDENPTTNTIAGLVNDVQLIISNIHENNPNTVVIVAQVINSAENSNLTSLTASFNSALGLAITESNTTRIVDMESALIYPDDIITDDPGSKAVHPTSVGYEKMANVWYNEVIYVIDNLLGTGPPPSDNNLVTNGGLESGNLNGWYTNNAFGGAVYTFDLNSSNAINGSNDARLNISSPGSANSRPMIICNLDENMVIGNNYTFRFKTNVTSGSPMIQFLNYGDGLKFLGALSGQQDWTFNVESAKSANNFIVFYVDGTSAGSFSIDDVVFEQTVVGDPPIITQQPLDQSVLIGDAAAFSVAVTGATPFNYQWRVNGTDIPGANSNTYSIPSTSLADNGNRYSCYITNSDGNALSDQATLTVDDGLPTITQQPQNVTVVEGQPASFTVSATGIGTLSYQWKKNGADIPGEISSSYTLDPTVLSDNGAQFTCVISNSYGDRTSNAAVLTVIEADNTPPNLLSASASNSTTVLLVFNEILNASTAANSANYSINNGITVSSAVVDPAGDKVTLTTSLHSTNSYTVTVGNVTDLSGNTISASQNTANYNYTEPPVNNNLVINGDFETGGLNGWYTNNAFGGAVYTFDLNSSNAVSRANDARLNITSPGSANSRPMLICNLSESMVSGEAYTFRFKTKVVSGSPKIQFLNYGDGLKFLGALSGQQDWTFNIESAASTNNFVVFYLDGTSAGSFSIDDVVFEVTVVGDPPIITQQPSDQSVLVGASAAFSVAVTGATPFTYQWRVNGTDIPGANSNTYSIPSTSLADNGNRYSCYITNSDGNTLSTEATLTVTDGSPLITSQPSNQSAAVGQTATFSVSATGQGILNYQWQKDNSNISGAISSSYTTSSLSLSDNGSTYRCIITNSFGSDTSNTVLLTVSEFNGPNLVLWYGDQQKFGQLGKMQNQINILGNVSHPDGVAALSYTLNGGPSRPLLIGPQVPPLNIRRLFNQGDFNIEIFVDTDSDLVTNGQNTIVITAQKVGGTVPSNQSQKTMYFDYYPTPNWAMPYSVRLDTITNQAIQDYVQVTDGRWEVGAQGLRTIEPAYDRVFGVGDVGWKNFEVKTKFFVHDVLPKFEKPSYGAGLFILSGWSGHTDDPIPGFEPKAGWQPYGSFNGYIWINQYGARKLSIGGNNGVSIDEVSDNTGVLFNVGEFYNMKLRVESTDGQADYFRLKFWPDSQSEPVDWILEGTHPSGTVEPESGSVLFIAHHVDMSFYSVDVTPISPPVMFAKKTAGSDRKGELYLSSASDKLNGEINLKSLAEKFPEAAFAKRLSSNIYESESPGFKMKSFEENTFLDLNYDSRYKNKKLEINKYPKIKIIKNHESLPSVLNVEPTSLTSGKADTLNLNSLFESFGMSEDEITIEIENSINNDLLIDYSNKTKELIIDSEEVWDTTTIVLNLWALKGLNHFSQSELRINLLPAKAEAEIPASYQLSQNYPNPFNPSTKIEFALPNDSRVRLVVYNILGQQVEELVSKEMNAGYHQLEWSPTNLASGVFVYRIEAKSVDGDVFVSNKKMMFLK